MADKGNPIVGILRNQFLRIYMDPYLPIFKIVQGIIPHILLTEGFHAGCCM